MVDAQELAVLVRLGGDKAKLGTRWAEDCHSEDSQQHQGFNQLEPLHFLEVWDVDSIPKLQVHLLCGLHHHQHPDIFSCS